MHVYDYHPYFQGFQKYVEDFDPYTMVRSVNCKWPLREKGLWLSDNLHAIHAEHLTFSTWYLPKKNLAWLDENLADPDGKCWIQLGDIVAIQMYPGSYQVGYKMYTFSALLSSNYYQSMFPLIQDVTLPWNLITISFIHDK